MSVQTGVLLGARYTTVNGNSVFRVWVRAPGDETFHFDMGNGPWSIENQTLQFMANWGYRPSDFEDGYTDLESDCTVLPITTDSNGNWALAQAAFSGGKQALHEADWFGVSEGSGCDVIVVG